VLRSLAASAGRAFAAGAPAIPKVRSLGSSTPSAWLAAGAAVAALLPALATPGGERPLSSPYLEERLAAEGRLRRDGTLSPDAWRALLLAPESKDRLGRFHVVSAAAEQPTGEVLAALAAFAADPDPCVRGAAADATIRVARSVGEDVAANLAAFGPAESAAALKRVVLADLEGLQSGVKPAGIHHDRDYRDLVAVGPAAIEALLRVVRDPAFKPDTRAAAVTALSRIGEGRVAGAIGSLLELGAKEAPSEVRIAAVAALCQLGRFGPDVRRTLVAGTRDFDASVRNYANWGLVTLLPPDGPLADEARRELSTLLVEQLERESDESVISILSFGAMVVRGPEIAAALVDAYDEAYGYAPFYVLEAIATYAGEDAAAAATLEKAARESAVPAERVLAAASLGRAPDEKSIAALESQVVRGLPQLDDESGLAVKTGVRALGLARGEAAGRILREKAKDQDDGIRAEALLALGVGRFADAADLLEEAAAFDRYEYARYFACASLRLLGDPRFFPFAIDLLDCGNFWVHGEVARLLDESTGKRFGYDPRAEPAERRRVQREIEAWWGESFDRLRYDAETGRFEIR